jgi:alpha-tubulin suppressor-like RCC1 family protein
MGSCRLARFALPLLTLCLLGLVSSSDAQAAGGTVLGWGEGDLGQVGVPLDGSCECVPVPTAVGGLSEVTEIVGGGHHTLALLANGTVMAWGGNEQGQLGTGPTNLGPRRVPAPVPGLTHVVAIAAGQTSSLALLANGTVMAWGGNASGELGLGQVSGPETCPAAQPVACSTVPVAVPGLTEVVAISAQNRGSLALLANGSVLTWGFDGSGQLGDGGRDGPECPCLDRPTPVPGVAGAVAISAGGNSGFALLADGTVKGWGINSSGELGAGFLTSRDGCGCLGTVAVAGLGGVKALAAGDEHALALSSDGTVQAWGSGSSGQLGTPSTNIPDPCLCLSRSMPVKGLSSPEAIAASTTSSLALLPNGGVIGWGSNGFAQLGGKERFVNVEPRAIGGVSGASAIAAGSTDSFALIGRFQSLKVSRTGAGGGAVGGEGILCPPDCEGRFPQGQVEILRAQPSPGSGFAGFSGPCTGTGPCQLRLDGDQTVTATFGPPAGTAIAKAKISSRTKSASFSFQAPGAITGFQCALIKPKVRRKRHRASRSAVRHKPKPHFSACAAPKQFKHLRPGRYSFEVRALDILGADPKPAIRHFAIRAPKPKHRRR